MDVLETARLVIRPFAPEDLEAAYQILDRDLAWTGPGYSRERRRTRLEFYAALASWDDAGRLFGYRAVIRRVDGALMGLCGFTPGLLPAAQRSLFGRRPLPPEEAGRTSLEPNVGYGLGSAFRGQGYATEAVRALLDHGLRVVGLRRIWAVTDRDNAGSARLMRAAARWGAAARGPRRRPLHCREGPPDRGQGKGAPAPAGRAGLPLGRDS